MRIELPATLNAFVQSCKKTISKWYGRTIYSIYKLPRITQLSLKTIRSLKTNPIYYFKTYGASPSRFLKQVSSGRIPYTDKPAREKLKAILNDPAQSQKYYKECIAAIETMYNSAAQDMFESDKQGRIASGVMEDFAILFKQTVLITKERVRTLENDKAPDVFTEKLQNALTHPALVETLQGKEPPPSEILWRIFAPFNTSSTLELMAAPTLFQHINHNLDKSKTFATLGHKEGSVLGADDSTPLVLLALLTVFNGDMNSLNESSPPFRFYESLFGYVSKISEKTDNDAECALAKYIDLGALTTNYILTTPKQQVDYETQ